MTRQQEKDIISSIKTYTKEALSSKENAQKSLVDLGICDENGELTPNYR
jgi:hypothetical protein